YGPRTVAFRALGQTIGRVRIDGDGDVIECGAAEPPLPLRWERLTVSPAGGPVLELTDGWLDRRACTAIVARTTTTQTRPLLRSAFYAFRERRPAGGERVVLLLPRARAIDERKQGPVVVDTGPITHVSVDLVPGTVASALL